MPLIRLALPGERSSIPVHPKKRQKQGARYMIQGICWCRTYFCHILWLKNRPRRQSETGWGEILMCLAELQSRCSSAMLRPGVVAMLRYVTFKASAQLRFRATSFMKWAD